MHASCCEGQDSRLFGSFPKFLYSLQGDDDDTRNLRALCMPTCMLPVRSNLRLAGSLPRSM